MSMTSINHPLATALSGVFGANANSHFITYGDKQAFTDLWFNGLESETPIIAGHQLDWNDRESLVLIVGESIPHEVLQDVSPCLKGINVRDQLTALSWAATWRLRHPDARVRMMVIGIEDENRFGITASALATLLRPHSMGELSFVPRMVFLSCPTLNDVLGWLGVRDDRRSALPSLPLLRSCVWEGLSSAREKHHAFSNLLGAYMLTAEVATPRTPSANASIESHLLGLIQTLGLEAGPLRGQLESPNTSPRPVGSWIASSLGDQLRGIVLLDDMAELWTGFLEGALGVAGDRHPANEASKRLISIPCAKFSNEMQYLPARLGGFLRSGQQTLTVGTLVHDNRQVQDDFVLFLDLRLFPEEEETPSGAKRGTFFRKLAEFGLALLDSRRSFPWLDAGGTLRLRKELVRYLTDTKAQRPKEPGAAFPPEETLLPRLLSLLDPTLPIVIFSSTHHSDLLDPFREYGNIITTFRKPILSGMTHDWTDAVTGVRAAFASAVEQAVNVLRVRRGISGMRACSEDLPDASSTTEARAVEIFVDETFLPEDKVYAVGAAVLLAENHRVIRSFCEALEAEKLWWGLSANNRDQFISETREPRFSRNRLVCARGWTISPNSAPEEYLPKRAGPNVRGRAASRIAVIAKQHRISVIATAIGCKVSKKTGERLGLRSLQGVSFSQTDELHRELTVRLLQLLFLAHPAIRNALSKSQGSIALDVGERTSEPEDYDERCESLFQKLGFRYSDQQWNELSPNERCHLWNQVLSAFKKNGKLLDKPDKVHLTPAGEINPSMQALEGWTGCKEWRLRRPRLMFSIASHDGLGFLRSALSVLHPSVNPTIVRSRGVPLFDFDAVGTWMIKLESYPCFPYQIHYLADWIALVSAIEVASPNGGGTENLAGFFDDGFIQEWTPEMRRLLLAVARLEDGDRAGGLADMLAWIGGRQNQTKPASTLTKLMLKRGVEAFAMLRGTELRALFESDCGNPDRQVEADGEIVEHNLSSDKKVSIR